VGRTDLLVFELIESRSSVFKTATQLSALNLLLAGVLVESAFRDPEIFGGLGVLKPPIVGIALKWKCLSRRRRCRGMIGNSRQCLPQHLNKLLGIPGLEHYAGNDSGITAVSLPRWILAVGHLASNRLTDHNRACGPWADEF